MKCALVDTHSINAILSRLSARNTGVFLAQLIRGFWPLCSAWTTPRVLTTLFSSAFALSAITANAAGASVWTIQLHRHSLFLNPTDTDFYGSTGYSTKAQAIAALKLLDTSNNASPAQLAAIKEQAISSMSAKSVTYQYSLPPQKVVMSPWLTFQFAGFPSYTTEAAAVAPFTFGTCGGLNISSTMVPSGDWVPGLGAPYNDLESRGYTRSIGSEPNCGTPVQSQYVLVGDRAATCPSTMFFSGLADNNCVNIYTG
jgi:hypothetical protein